MELSKIAVLITCHNRRQTTLACLAGLFTQDLPSHVSLSTYLVDDGSTDRTSEAVSETYPEVKIISGDGSLYWNGGMRVAFEEALKSNYDYYLWLNDDTTLYPEAIAQLLTTYAGLTEAEKELAIVVGGTCDPEIGEATYGGLVRNSSWHPLKFRVVPPDGEVKRCDTMSGNCVLIPRVVTQTLGNLESAFIHSKGDWDYGLRLGKKGGAVWLAPQYIGTCQEHLPNTNCWDNPDLTLRERVNMVLDPRCLPIGEWRLLLQRHAGVFWPFYWLSPYLRLFSRAAYFKLQKVKHSLFGEKNSSFS
jgi:GT2 family glycosyltransferase